MFETLSVSADVKTRLPDVLIDYLWQLVLSTSAGQMRVRFLRSNPENWTDGTYRISYTHIRSTIFKSGIAYLG